MDCSKRFVFCCRICLQSRKTVKNLFDQKSNGKSLADMISYCTQSEIQQNDDLPSKLCLKCEKNLKIAYDFCVLAKASEEQLQNTFIDLPQYADESTDPSFVKKERDCISPTDVFSMPLEKECDMENTENDGLSPESDVKEEKDDEEMSEISEIEIKADEVKQPANDESFVETNKKFLRKVKVRQRAMRMRNSDDEIRRRHIFKTNDKWECYKCEAKFLHPKNLQWHLKVCI